MRDKSIILRKSGFRHVVCVAVVCFQLFVFSLSVYSQTFSGGSGTSADPYKISKPEDLVELYTITNVNDGIATVGKYFEMTNNIDMAGISGFRPIGLTDKDWNTYSFCGNFDGKGFAIKNLSIIDTAPASPQVAALFGDVRGAKINNVILDNASFFSNGYVISFVGYTQDSLHMDNCIALNCTLKSKNTISGFIYQGGGGRISNCHVINTNMVGDAVLGFCNQGTNFNNSSVRYSTLTSNTSAGIVSGFVATLQGQLANCYVSNCVLSSNGYIGGLVYMFPNGEIDNCGVQAVISRTKAVGSSAAGFAWWCGAVESNMRISNSYAACEFKSVDNVHDYDAAFGGIAYYGTITISNCYHKEDTKLLGVNNDAVVEKKEADIKNVAMVAYPGSQDNSLNYNQPTTPWVQDFINYPINKGYPILEWMQERFFYVSTYHPTDLGNTFATLQGLTFAEGEGIITERGFKWRQKGIGNWTKVPVPDTTFNISHFLTGLTKNAIYEYYAYMRLATETTERYGDTVEFTASGETGIVETGSTRPIQIYPNPTDGQLRITGYELRANTVIEIFSVVGQVVYTSPQPSPSERLGEVVIDISHLVNGMYFLKVDGKTVKFVKK